MLKNLSYISLIVFIVLQYGHNAIPSEYSIDFYFITLAVFTLILSIIIRMLISNLATNAMLCLSISKLFNEVIFQGDATYLEISFAMFLLALSLIPKKTPDGGNYNY